LIFVKKDFPSSKLKWLPGFMQFPAELHVSFASLYSFHIVISSTLYASSLVCWDRLWTLQTKGKDVMAAYVL